MIHPDWKATLIDSGAEFRDLPLTDDATEATEILDSFGNKTRELRASQGGNVFYDLSHNGLLSVYGKDALRFLQGQLSCDTNDLDQGLSRLGALCTHKGRMISLMRLFRHQGRYLLSLPADLLMTTGQTLAQFVVADDVNIDDASSTSIGLGLSGPSAADELQHAVGKIPEGIDQCLEHDGLTLVQVPAHRSAHGEHKRYEIHGELPRMQKLWMQLNARCAPVGQPCADLLEIQAGVPRISKASSEAFVPQMTNLQQLAGISFNKGCYTGQEVIARMQFRGELKRRLYLARCAADNIAPATTVWQAGGRSTIGKVLQSAPHPDGGSALLAVLQIARAESATNHIENEDGPELTLLELPYSLEGTSINS